MKFSVVIPVYNVEKYLKKCIDSVLEQSFTDYEIILVVDGSPDHSIEICEYYQSIHTNIRVINMDNEGATAARKAGSHLAAGDYIVCVDGDDYIEKDLLESAFKIVSQYKDIDIITFGYYKVQDGNIILPAVFNECREGFYDGNSYQDLMKGYLFDPTVHQINSGNLLYGHPLKIIRKEIFNQSIDKLPEYLVNGEDIYFTALALELSKSIYVISKPMYYYRVNQNSLTRKRKPYDLVNINRVYECLQTIGFISDIGKKVYYYRSALIIIRDMARDSANYSALKKIITENYSPIADKEGMGKLDLEPASSFKLKLITNKRFRMIYCLSKLHLLK